MHISRRGTNLNDLRRDPADGAYHCPKCDFPFTRRSNLRRHYSIHIRGMTEKCRTCNKAFSDREELQYHTVHCYESIWNTSASGENNQNGLSPDFSGTLAEPSGMDEGISFGQHPIPIDLFSLAELLPAHQEDDFSSLLSPLIRSSTQNIPLSTMLPYNFGVSQDVTPSGIASPARGSSPSIHSGNYNNPLATPSRGMRPRQEPCFGGSRRKTKEKPIYTRRQVEDMLDIVSNCFVGRMEEVLARINVNPPPGEHATDNILPLNSRDNEQL